MKKSIFSKLTALMACAVVGMTGMVGATGINASAAELDTPIHEDIVTEYENISNLSYSGYYYSAINNGYIYLSAPASGSYSCTFSNVYMNGSYFSGSASAFLSVPNVWINSGTQIGTFTYYISSTGDGDTCPVYYYNNSYSHNITIIINGIPYEKSL